jgi:methylase of polypeptide subunit release factors
MTQPGGAWAETKVIRGRVMRVIAHDPLPFDEAGNRLPLPADYVMGVGGATQTLLDLTPSRHVGRALDLGCGCGVQSLFLNAARIVATDIDQRALAAANESFHLSGFRRVDTDVWRNGDTLIELREGSLLDPVEGQRFDLIVANPPFVIEGAGHVHRDSPLASDGLVRELLTQLPTYLNLHGRAIILACWLHPEGGEWQRRLLSWLPRDVSVWIAQRETLDLEQYVDVWAADAGLDAAERLKWLARLEGLDVEAIGFGWIVLERSPTHWVMIEDVSGASRVPNGEEVERQLAAFTEQPGALELLHRKWRFVDDHWRGPLALDAVEALLLDAMRRGATLAEAVDAVAGVQPVDADDLLALGLTRTRALVELGYLTA